ncbi:MAG: hypothetical protein NTV97_28455 [Alphaproteobacteria bacterium]|nr:hypothetical protein [Alphaproteobacteria bacterium]
MKRRALAAAPLFLLAAPAFAQLKIPANKTPAKWYAVQVEDRAFTVEMPGVPDHRLLNDASARGTAFVLHSYSLDLGGYSYVVQTALYPADVDVTRPRVLLQAALDERATALAGRKWTRVDWREMQGGAVADSTGPVPGGNAVRQLVLLKGRRFVSLAFLGASAGASGPEAERFFRSLKLQA